MRFSYWKVPHFRVFFNFIRILLFLWLRSPCEVPQPYDNPFWEKGIRGRKEKRKIPKIVSNLSGSAGRTHIARTNLSIIQLKCLFIKLLCIIKFVTIFPKNMSINNISSGPGRQKLEIGCLLTWYICLQTLLLWFWGILSMYLKKKKTFCDLFLFPWLQLC